MQSFTVTKLDGSSYDATSLIVTQQDGTGFDSISFVCSGRMVTFLVSDVKSIEWKSGIVVAEAASAGSPA